MLLSGMAGDTFHGLVMDKGVGGKGGGGMAGAGISLADLGKHTPDF